jgi:hypothetical protein
MERTMTKKQQLQASVYTVFALTLGFGMSSMAEETVLEKVETSQNRAQDSVKKAYRGSKNKTCEMINGKLECLGKKAANKARDISDKSKTDAVEAKNKID